MDIVLLHQGIRGLIFKIGWQRIVLSVLMAAILVPSLFVNWMIIDDGISLQNSQKISHYLSSFDFQGLSDLFIEREGGRYRPMYWVYYWVSYMIAGKSAFGFHLIHALMVAGTVYLLFLIIELLTSSKTAALIGSSLFLLTPLNMENWYRLGTPESMFTFYLGLSIYCLLKVVLRNRSVRFRKFYFTLSLLAIGMAYFTKETFFAAFLPIPFLLFLGRFWIKEGAPRKLWSQNTLSFFLISLALTGVVLFLTVFIRVGGNYSVHYSFSLSDSLNAGRSYLRGIYGSFGIFPKLALLSFFISMFLFFKKRQLSFSSYLQIVFLIGGLSFLAVLLPWSFVLGRYLEPVIFLLIVAFSFETGKILRFITQVSRVTFRLHIWDRAGKFIVSLPLIAVTGIVIFHLSFIYSNFSAMFNYVSDTILGSRVIARTLQTAASQAKQEGTVFMNLQEGNSTVELVFEGGLHLGILYNRPDLKVEYLNEKNLANLKQGDLVLSAFTGNSWVKYGDEVFLKDSRLQKIWSTYHSVPTLSLSTPSPKSDFIRLSSSENLWRIYQAL